MSGYSTEVRAILKSPEAAAQWARFQCDGYVERLRQKSHGSSSICLVGMMTTIMPRSDGAALAVFKPNGITDAGYDFIANSMVNRSAGGALTQMGYIAIGTGTAAFAATQTALSAELARQTATYSHVAGSKLFTIEAYFAPGIGTGSITEAGVFNASSGGTMLDRVVSEIGRAHV